MEPGTVFAFALPDGRRGVGQVIAVEARVVAVALWPGLWDCEPPADAAAWGEPALPHVALRPAALAEVTPIGRAEVRADARAAHESWRAGPAPAVLAAPPGVLLAALV